MTQAALRIVDGVRSHVGMVRKENEDAFLARPEAGLWGVADGMGGHEHGRRAADAIVAALWAVKPTGVFETDAKQVADAIHAANARIWAEAQAAGASMGSTAAVLLIQDRRFAVVWAGDSRVYLLRDGVLHRLTRDHTQVQEMVDRGLLTAEEARGHPMSHVLSRAVGVAPDVELDAVADEVELGDVYLICSDGLYGVVPEPQIAARVGSHSPEAACDRLIELCLRAGAPDNVTLVAVSCEQATLLSLAPASA
jgi:serine/threonine protein phosphatase PrpC